MTRVSTFLAGLCLFGSFSVTRAATTAAVVNIPVVSERYAKTTDLESRFEALRRDVQKRRDEKHEHIIRARRALQEELKPGTPTYEERRKQVAMLEAELQWFMESEAQKIEGGLADSLREIFSDIQSIVRELAEERQIDIVLASDQIGDRVPAAPAQVRQHILMQKVVYWSPQVDLTEEVISRINARYHKAGGAGAPRTGGGSGGGARRSAGPVEPSQR